MEHTPIPWAWMHTPSAHSLDHPRDAKDYPWDGSDGDDCFDRLSGPNGESVLFAIGCNDDTAEIVVANVADRRILVRAVNNHAKLLEALEPLAAIAADWPPNTPDTACLYDEAFIGLSLGDARRARAVIEEAKK